MRLYERSIEMKKNVSRAVCMMLILFLTLGNMVSVSAAGEEKWFNAQKYRETYSDLEEAFGDDWDAYFKHYLTYGLKEGRDGGGEWNAAAYVNRYPDLKEAFGYDFFALINHYATYGMKEGRDATTAIETYYAADSYEEENDAEEDRVTIADTSSGQTLVYMPVTLYDYDTQIINSATAKAEQTTTYSGIYFGSDSVPEGAKNLAWNDWKKGEGKDEYGQKFYTGLVAKKLDSDKNLVFTKTEGGIFNEDTSVKEIYKNVQMPFVYGTDGFYTLDASKDGIYFHADEGQQSDAKAADGARLYFNAGNPQSNGSYGDESTTVWAPFNDGTTFSNMNYYFGMRATVPFTMTANGRSVGTDDTSEEIKFHFSGDDDVWVFIDGQLVVDLGGIHNRLDVEINFAQNTVTYSADNTGKGVIGSYNDSDFAMEQELFGNLIMQDRESFAATTSHELTIFYLERGAGSSNCEIKFNLPVEDYVMVTKDATQSADEKGEIGLLTAEEQAKVDQIDFGFTLYRQLKADGAFETISNTNYYLLSSNGQVIDTRSTDANGHFTLKNGQSAKFITTDLDKGAAFYVVEDAVEGFHAPSYSYKVESSSYQLGEQNENAYASGQVDVVGSNVGKDSLTFICTNYLNAELPNPTALPKDDMVVLDYGLPVKIDVLKNDLYRGDKIEILSVKGSGEDGKPQYGEVSIQADGTLLYTLTKQLSGVEVLEYEVRVTGTGKISITGTEITLTETGSATLYIIPATSMYYEENFSDFVTYTGKNWEQGFRTEETYTDAFQEPGVVGTIGDSPYGSDQAYLNDSHDSNGTSKYASTDAGAVAFSYIFTGTGTSFFARTTANSGYMRVVVSKEDGTLVQELLRDTKYVSDSEQTLYNVPVFTTEELDYGTYKVTVTIAKKNTKHNYGGEFWLDGIRIMEPLGETDAQYEIALKAYAADGEANMTKATLRQKLLSETDYTQDGDIVWKDGDNFVLFTDSNHEIQTAEEYESIGPKEEVYLNDGQSVWFSLTEWDPNMNKLYLGVKAPLGQATAVIGKENIKLDNAVDCYYDISRYAVISTDESGVKTVTFTIQAGEGSLISVTNIKVTGSAKFTIIPNTDINIDGAEGEDDF